MATADAQGEIPLAEPTRRDKPLRRHALLVPALPAVGLMVLWAEHDGGYDADTWYWGALALLGLLTATVIALGPARARLSRYGLVALAGLATYTAWSYLSILWAQSQGLALQGSNRTLLYLLMFTLLLILPWTPRGALAALLVFTLGLGALAVVLLARLAGGDHVLELIVQGRLVAPTGYFNSSAALFMIATLLAVALAARRDLPPPVRGVLIALACASLQLCVLGQSRGWLFTLPLVALLAIAIVQERLRYVAAWILPLAATLATLHPLLGVFKARASAAVVPAAAHAGHVCLLTCAGAFVIGTLLAWMDSRVAPRQLPRLARLALGAAVAAVVLAGAAAGAIRVAHGHPGAFVSRQWRAFTHAQASRSSGSHFTAAGSGRYDFWRVSLEALRAHPLGGLGQDNFADYYVTHRRTREEPASAHSMEMSLLAETGIIGFALFVVFLAAAVAGAVRARCAGPTAIRGIVGAAMLPFIVWLIHGSVDWFWEMPAITAAALGFLAVALALDRPMPQDSAVASSRRPLRRAATVIAAAITVLACTIVLGFPYLSVREVSLATDVASSNPAQALRDLSRAGQLNPLSPDPGRIAGTIALETGRYREAARSFAQATSREPGGWYAWLGAGLAASALGQKTVAKHDLAIAAQINPQQRVVKRAAARVLTARPLPPVAALRMLVLVN